MHGILGLLFCALSIWGFFIIPTAASAAIVVSAVYALRVAGEAQSG